VVILYGSILKELEGRILLDIAPQLGDAREFGLVGQMWFGKRQCRIEEARVRGQHDVIRISYALAVSKSQAAGKSFRKRNR
jgi:hypothetical protein